MRVDGVYCRDQRLVRSFHLVFSAATSRVSTNFRSKLQIYQRVSFRFIKSIGKQEKFSNFLCAIHRPPFVMKAKAGEIGKHQDETLAFVSTD